MGAWGGIVMAFFGALFASLTLGWGGLARGWAVLAPFAVFALSAVAAARVVRRPGVGVRPSPAGERTIAASTVAEGIGLFAVNAVLGWLHRPDLRLPAMALVVGLHFLPIAIAERFRPFGWLGAALIMAAGAGWLVDGAVAGFAAAAALWTAAWLAIRRDARAKAGQGGGTASLGASSGSHAVE